MKLHTLIKEDILFLFHYSQSSYLIIYLFIPICISSTLLLTEENYGVSPDESSAEFKDLIGHCKAFSTPYSHPPWTQEFASASCFHILLAWIPPLMLNTIFKTIQHKWQYHCFIYFNFQIFPEKSGTQKCLDWIITCYKSMFYFLVNRISIF